MPINKFYVEYQDECCYGMAVGRVPLRIIGGVCIGLGLIQIGLSSYVYDCYTDIKFGTFDNGAWWAGVACVITGCFGAWSFNRGVVITTNLTALVGVALGCFAIYVDKSGIEPLLHSNPTYRYCAQAFAATFIFDIVVAIMSLTMFITSFLSLVFPSVFRELDIEKYRRENAEAVAAASNANSKANDDGASPYGSPRIDYSNGYDNPDHFDGPNPQFNSRVIKEEV